MPVPERLSPQPVMADTDEHNFQAELPRSNSADLHVDKDLILQTTYSEDRIHLKPMPLIVPDGNGSMCGNTGACQEPGSETDCRERPPAGNASSGSPRNPCASVSHVEVIVIVGFPLIVGEGLTRLINAERPR